MADPTPKLPPMPETDTPLWTHSTQSIEDFGLACYERGLADAREAAQSIEQARELSDEEIDRLIQQHVDPVATYKRLHGFARAVLAAARSPQTGKEGA